MSAKNMVLLSLCLLSLLAGPTLAAEEADVMARVGDETIYRKQFEQDLQFRVQQIEFKSGQPVEVTEQLRQDVLAELINGLIVQILARNAGTQISEEELGQAFENGKASFRSEAEYQQYLSDQELTEDALKQELRLRLMKEKFVADQEIDTEVGEELLQAAYERLRDEGVFNRPGTTADVRHILIRGNPEDPDSWNAARERSAAARDRILKGENFEDVARELSEDDESAQDGGLYLEVSKGRVPEAIEQQIFALPVGEVSEPFPGPIGWHLLLVLERNEGGVAPLDKVRKRVIEHLLQQRRLSVVADRVQAAKTVLQIEIPALETPESQGEEVGIQ